MVSLRLLPRVARLLCAVVYLSAAAVPCTGPGAPDPVSHAAGPVAPPTSAAHAHAGHGGGHAESHAGHDGNTVGTALRAVCACGCDGAADTPPSTDRSGPALPGRVALASAEAQPAHPEPLAAAWTGRAPEPPDAIPLAA